MKKTIIVSGGSRGLGLQLVQTCLSKGYKVASFARKSTLEIENLRERYGGEFYFEELDASNSRGLGDFINRTEAQLGELFGLINNAAIGQDNLLTHLSEDAARKIVDVNIMGFILLTKAFLKRVLLKGIEGRIVNISSICGARGYAGLTVYSATKGAMDAFTRSLAREVGERKILVNCIGPGFFASEMSAILSDDQLDTIRRRTATRSLTEPEDMMPLLDSLLFNNHNITGQVFYVDGGASL